VGSLRSASHNRHGYFGGRQCLSDLIHHLPHVILDALQEWLKLRRGALDTL
jgi:hypothetical protein